MARLVYAGLLLFLFLCLLGVYYIKDSIRVLPVSSTPMPQPFQTWQTYTSEAFTAKFPFYPQSARETVQDPLRVYNMHIAEMFNGSIFMVTEISFPDSKEVELGTAQKLVQDLIASNPQNKLVDMHPILEGYTFSYENDQTTTSGKIILENNLLYLLSYTADKQHYNKADYDYFLSSFKLHE